MSATLAVSPDTFRSLYPEFDQKGNYPDPVLNFYLTFASNSLSAARWSTWLQMGVCLFAAHNIVLARRRALAAKRGLPPGESTGVISSKAVGPASVSYDTTIGSEADAGQWNLTDYGKQFIYYARLVGAGPQMDQDANVAFFSVFPDGGIDLFF